MKTKLLYLTSILLFSFGLNAQKKVWTLQECVNHALENNISIKQSELDRKNQEQNIISAKTRFLPNLNGSVSQNFNFGSQVLGANTVEVNSSRQSVGLGSSVVLYDGFANKRNLEQSRIDLQAQDATLAKMKNDISLNVANQYLQVLFAKEQIKISEYQVEISKQELKRTGELVEEGALPKGDLLNIKATLSNDEQGLIAAENSYNIAVLRLAQLLLLQDLDIEIEDVDVNVVEQKILLNSPANIFDKAFDTFPEITRSKLNIKSAEKSVAIAEAGFKPTLSFDYRVNTFIFKNLASDAENPTFANQFTGNLNNSLSLTLNVPIYNRQQNKVAVNQAKINYERAKYSLQSDRQTLRETIQTAFTDAVAAVKTYESSKHNVDAQKEAFRYSQERFDNGAIVFADFNQAKNNLFVSESQLIRAKYDLTFKLKVLEFYYGVPFSSN